MSVGTIEKAPPGADDGDGSRRYYVDTGMAQLEDYLDVSDASRGSDLEYGHTYDMRRVGGGVFDALGIGTDRVMPAPPDRQVIGRLVLQPYNAIPPRVS